MAIRFPEKQTPEAAAKRWMSQVREQAGAAKQVLGDNKPHLDNEPHIFNYPEPLGWKGCWMR